MIDDAVAYEVEKTIEGPFRDLYIVKRHGDQHRYIMALFELLPEDREHAQDEVARCVELTHPAVVPVVDAFETEDDFALVFEKVEGVTLQRVLEHLEKSDEALADAAVFHIATHLFGALEAAHTAHDQEGQVAPLVHAELGPHQVFVSWEGEVKLLGVGMSTLYRLAAASQLAAPAATPYAAPEVLLGGALTVRANVYSAAAMVWSLLMRQIPPTDGSIAPKLTDVRPDLDPAVVRALDEALAPSLIKRRITAGALANLFASHATEGAQQLRWGVDVLRAIETFDESLFGMESLPAPKLSRAAPDSMPVMITLAPSDDTGFDSLPPPSSDGIPISLIPASAVEDAFDYDAPTIPPQARKK